MAGTSDNCGCCGRSLGLRAGYQWCSDCEPHLRHKLEPPEDRTWFAQHGTRCPFAPYSTVREFLGHVIGAKVLDVTQHDKEEFDEDPRAFVELTFDNGARARFYCDEFVYDDAAITPRT